jgi:hypothetical protein
MYDELSLAILLSLIVWTVLTPIIDLAKEYNLPTYIIWIMDIIIFFSIVSIFNKML